MDDYGLTRQESGRFVVGKQALHCGDAIALQSDGGAVLTGRVEWNDHLGWYFTDDRGRQIRLNDGDSAALI